MSKENSLRQQTRQRIAQQAARLMAEDGISDFSYAKKKAGRQLGVIDSCCLPTNAEIEEEIKLHQEIYQSDEQPATLLQLRTDALQVMKILDKFNPHLTGPVLDGTAGRYAETHIHLFADSMKDVEMFLLNNQIPYETDENSFRTGKSRRGNDKKGNDWKKVPVFTLNGPNGLIKLSVFSVDDMRSGTMHAVTGGQAAKANTQSVQSLVEHLEHY